MHLDYYLCVEQLDWANCSFICDKMKFLLSLLLITCIDFFSKLI